MRIWHKELIPVLPRQQLVAQWRELCLIAKNVAEKGSPRHILVNKVTDYPIEHLFVYGCMVALEMKKRGYKCKYDNFERWFVGKQIGRLPSDRELFENWHNERYFTQCICNLEEKYDCGGVSDDEWKSITEFVKQRGGVL